MEYQQLPVAARKPAWPEKVKRALQLCNKKWYLPFQLYKEPSPKVRAVHGWLSQVTADKTGKKRLHNELSLYSAQAALLTNFQQQVLEGNVRECFEKPGAYAT